MLLVSFMVSLNTLGCVLPLLQSLSFSKQSGSILSMLSWLPSISFVYVFCI